jgi:anion-transporting  ArsA/GET3 family ATPase
VLKKIGAIDFATTIAPGVRDVLLTGKVYAYEAVGKPQGPGGRRPYDAVVLDAPPTGRIARFLNVNTEVAGLARVGPIRNQADSIMEPARRPRPRCTW